VETDFDAHPELKTTGTPYYPFQRIKWAEEQRMLEQRMLNEQLEGCWRARLDDCLA
jgi:hypothetical protein